jgi:hypothetical protein
MREGGARDPGTPRLDSRDRYCTRRITSVADV